MKKLILIITLFLPLIISAQKITNTYNFKDFKVKNVKNYSLIEFENCMQIGKNGQAMMPYKAVKLLLPPGTQAKSVKVKFSQPKSITGAYTLYPKQKVRTISEGKSGEFMFDDNFYKSAETMGEIVRYKVNTQYLNGHSIAITHFTPLRYVPTSKKLYFYQKVQVEIIAKKSDKAQQANKLYKTNPTIKSTITDYIDNPDFLNQYANIQRNKINDYQVLIISRQFFAKKFEPMQKKYLARGLKSKFKNVNEIYNEMSGVDKPEKIRNYIIQEYTQHNIEYVFLAGDTEIIPYRGFFCQVQSQNLVTDSDIPSDLYYSALDGNWNTNNNDKWGEIGEDDLLPELSVARLPFSTNDELDNMLNKIIQYQESPVVADLTNPLLAGEKLHDNPETWGSDYLDLLIGYRTDNGYATTGIPENQPFTKLYAKDNPENPWGKTAIINEINKGHSFVYHAGHSNTNYTMHLLSEDITDENFNQVNGTDHINSVVYTHGCICGDFSAQDCISEDMLKIKNFAAGFIGNSRYGWFNEGQTEGPSLHIHREFMNAVYKMKQNNIGEAHKISKLKTAEWVNAPNQHEEGALRWCFYDCNALSDPTLPLWTNAPENIVAEYENSIPLNQNTYSVTLKSGNSPISDIVCTLLQDSVLLGSAKTKSNGIAEININKQSIRPGIANLVITGYNCKKISYQITITNTDAPFILVNKFKLNDANNNIPENNEIINLNIDFKNIGGKNAENCVATLSTNDSYINPSNKMAEIGTISADDSVYLENALSFSTKKFIPDQHISLLTINTVCQQNSWQKDIEIKLNAPIIKPEISKIKEIEGNANGIFEANEKWEIIFRIQNKGHSKSPACIATLNIENTNVNAENNIAEISSIEAQSYTDVKFEITAGDDVTTPYVLNANLALDAEEYSTTINFKIDMKRNIETFETNDFSLYDWQLSGDAEWQIFSEDKHNGKFSAVSGMISGSQSSVMAVDFNVIKDDTISFYKKISSEPSGDCLNFYIDKQKVGQWSGEDLDWTLEKFPVEMGKHTFKWEYKKDYFLSANEDRVLIDDISFPLVGETSEIEIPTAITMIENKGFNINCYPNPFDNFINIRYNLNSKSNVIFQLYTISGSLVTQVKETQNKGINHLAIENISVLKSGIYIWKLTTNNHVQTGKIIKTK